MGDGVWVKASHSQCTSRFGKERDDWIDSPQTVLVNGTLRHVKDLRPLYESSPSENGRNSTLSENGSDTPLVLRTGSESPPGRPRG